MKLKKPILSGLLFITLLANLFVPAFAYNSQGSTTDQTTGKDEVQKVVTEYEETTNSSSETQVYATRSSTFTALIPKTIILDGIDGDATYVVGAKGDVLDADSISIAPDSNELILYKKGDASQTVVAGIEQLNTLIAGTNIKENVYSTLQGSIQAEGLKAGSWNGQMKFIITLSQTNVPVHKHTLTHVDAVEATEEQPGNIEYWHCTDCDRYYRDAECTQEISEAETVIPQLNHTHNMVHTAAKDPTATEDGNIEYWYCDKCGKYYSDANGVNEISADDIAIIPIYFALDASNKDKIKYKGTANEDLVIPAVFKDEEDGKWYKVTTIRGQAFYGCSGLTSVTIPDSVTSIGNHAFDGCTALTSIEVSPDNPNYSSVDGVLFNKDKTRLIRYPIGKTGATYTIPDSVTSIGVYAFSDCTGLTSVTIPDSVTNIGYGAFYRCSGLTSITVPDSVTFIDGDIFADCTNLTVKVPDTLTWVSESAFAKVPKVIYNGTLDTSDWGAKSVVKG